MPITIKMVATKWTIMERRLRSSRPNLGQMAVTIRPIRKITTGLEESATTEARAIDGAAIIALYCAKSLIIHVANVQTNGR